MKHLQPYLKKVNMKRVSFHCSSCGELEDCHYFAAVVDVLQTHQLCHECNFWREFKLRYDHGISFVIQGVGYNPNFNSTGMKGFGGRKFKLKVLSGPAKGQIIKSDNLWCRGNIPARFKSTLPDNAEFVIPEA